jgi:zinc protease
MIGMKERTAALCAALTLTLTLAPATALAQAPPRVDIDVEHFTLPNGLHVILQRDATTPMIASNIWYHVGSAHERPGRTGFAHLFEHIMFEGSKNVPEGAIDKWFEAVGGSPNGSTTRDRTNYHQAFSASALDLALFIESDRMGFLLDAMTPATVDGQRDVVKNERRQSYDNRPYGVASQVVSELLYPSTHPYHWPVIGYMDHLSAAGHDDVQHFFRTFYAPNNAALALVGDFDVAEARSLVTRWFSQIPAGQVVAELTAPQPRLDAQQRVTLEDRVQLPRLQMAWHSPAAFAPGDAELNALADLLTDGRNSRLHRRLVYDMQIAADVVAYQNSGKLGSDFHIIATARPGHTLAELEAVILEELDRVRREAPADREVQRIVNQYEAGFFEALERIATKADLLNYYLFHTGTPDYFNEDLARYRALRPADLSEAARSYLDPERRVVLSVVPQGRAELAAAGSRVLPAYDYSVSPPARGVAHVDVAPVPAPDRSVRPTVGETPDVELPDVHRFKLANGLEVLVLEKRTVPLVQTNLIVRAGSVRDPSDRLGLASLTADMLDEGAAGRSALEIADAMELLGARFFSSAGTHHTTVGLRVPVSRWEEGLAIMADVVLRPDFPQAEMERLRSNRITALIRQHDDPDAVASVLFGRTLYGAAHPYGREAMTESSLLAMDVSDVRTFYQRHYQPGNATLVVVGDVNADAARRALEDAFGQWERGPVFTPMTAGEQPAQLQGRTIYLVDQPGAAQSVILMGRIGVPRSTPDFHAIQVMNTILGGSFTSRLNQNLREDKGYTYGARSAFAFLPMPGPFSAGAAVQTNVTGPALREFMNELRAIREQPITEEEVALSRNFLASRFPGSFQSVSDIAGQLADLVMYDLPSSYFDDYVDNVMAVTRADVERVAREHVDPDHMAIIIVGDRSVIEAQVREQDLGPIRFLQITDVLGAVPVLSGQPR